jgi:hypothetical protein
MLSEKKEQSLQDQKILRLQSNNIYPNNNNIFFSNNSNTEVLYDDNFNNNLGGKKFTSSMNKNHLIFENNSDNKIKYPNFKERNDENPNENLNVNIFPKTSYIDNLMRGENNTNSRKSLFSKSKKKLEPRNSMYEANSKPILL